VFRFITRMLNDAGRAEDLVSEVFIDVWSQADHFQGRSKVLTWILPIARHKTLSALLAQRRPRIAEIDDTALELIGYHCWPLPVPMPALWTRTSPTDLQPRQTPAGRKPVGWHR
jgi:DNA-directed RNA polymerase specialized sigma24 family protein